MSTTNHPTSRSRLLKAVLGLGIFISLPALAADWSDTYLSYRWGTAFRESYVNQPGGVAQNITKHIVSFDHTSGYKYGINWFNVDLLMSNNKDAAGCQFSPNPPFPFAPPTCGGSAQDVYVDYRHHLEWGKVTGKPAQFLFVKDLAFTLGFDWQTQSNAQYNSKQRRWLYGPTVELDVPGYMNVGFYGVTESNQPCAYYLAYGGRACTPRFTYKWHGAVMSSWAIPIGSLPLSYEGYANIMAAKGISELNNPTVPELNWDSQIMADVGSILGGPKATFKVGFEYQYWRNKYGNDHSIVDSSNGPGPGAFARTPQVRVEYHF